MISCFLIGKDSSVCVRFITNDSPSLKPWIDKFNSAPCHVHSESDGKHANFENEIKAWLESSSCVSAAMFIDSRLDHASDPSFLKVCARAKRLGVFTGLFTNGDKPMDLIKLLHPNWILSIRSAPAMIEAKVNEILGVVRFSVFSKEPSQDTA